MQIEWKGRYTFSESEVKKLVMKKGGNYIILVKQKNGNYRPVYVGKTKCLEERFLKHLSSDESNNCLRNHVKDHILGMRYCYINNDEDRKNIEYTLYHHYDHECNEKEPEGRKITINFPF